MATIAEIQAEIEQIGRDLRSVGDQVRATRGEDEELLTKRQQLRRRLSELNRELAVASNQSPATGEFEGQDATTGLYRYKNPVTGSSFLSGTAPTAAQQAASGVKLDPPLTQPEPPATASQTVSDDAPQGPNAPPAAEVNASGRIVAPPDTSRPSNAETPVTSDTGGDTGTNDPVRTTEQTQATGGNGGETGINVRAEDGTLSNLRKNPESGELYDPGSVPGNTELKTESGTPTRDDAADNSTSTKQAEVNTSQASLVKVIPQPNVLDDYYSYSYQISVYLANDSQYKRLLYGNNLKLDGYQLLFQTGGAPLNRDGVRPRPAAGTTDQDGGTVPPEERNYPDGGRSPFFDNDFYIDSVTLDNLLPVGGNGGAHSNIDIKFTLIEPQGITLLERLRDAVDNHMPVNPDGKVNYVAATYIMVIRFYGYDQSGNIVMPIKGGLTVGSQTSDTQAVVEKIIPFKIKNIDWTVSSKTTSYEWTCKPVGQDIGGSTARGTIPYDLQLNASSVEKLLNGQARYASQSTPSPAKPGASTTTGNQTDANQSSAETRRLAGAGTAQQRVPAPTQASVRAVDNAIDAAAKAPQTAVSAPNPSRTIVQGLMQAMNDFQQKLVLDGVYEQADNYSIEFVGPGAEKIAGATLVQPNVKIPKVYTNMAEGEVKPPEKDRVDMASRSFSITAGQQILQVIELVLRNSSYIGSQALFTIDENGKQIPTKNLNYNEPVKWYVINMSAQPRSSKLDGKRNDYAYDIKYTVSPFLIKNLNSIYFPVNKFSGIHKSYPYWFTGQNTAVLEYQETLNTIFRATLSGSVEEDSLATKVRNSQTASLNDIMMYTYQARSTESSQNALGKSFELGANAAELLYDPVGLREAKIKIIGDPAWIAQGSLFRPVNQETFGGKALTSGFMPDGSIAFDNQEILFEIVWQRPEDYDLNTGLADPYSKTQKKYNARVALQSRVYAATKVTSEFRSGRFEQTLVGKIYTLVKPDASNAANPSVAALATNAAGSDAGRGKTSSQATVRGIDNAIAARARAEAETAAAQQARSDFAKTDPRRLDTGDGGKRAILGAQGAYKEATFATNAGGAAFGNPNLARQGITSRFIRNQPPPEPPTDGTGQTVSPTTVEVASVPPKLPEATVTPGQAAAALNAQRIADLRARAAGTAPKYRPGQPIATEGG
jgi:hypothetical protein